MLKYTGKYINLSKSNRNYGPCGLLVFLLLFFCFLVPGKAAAKEALVTAKHVLFISSYSLGWESVPGQIKGLRKELEDIADLQYIFMYSKELPSEDAIARAKQSFGIIQNIQRKFDVIVVGDDLALEFALKHRAKYFGTTPLVFLGINTEKAALAAAKEPDVTGVMESFALEDTLAAALKIQPTATTVVGITDDSESGRGSTQQLIDCMETFPTLNFRFIDTTSLTKKQLIKKLRNINKNKEIAMFLMFTKDGDNNYYTLRNGVEFVNNYLQQPVYRNDETGLNYGLMGGKLISFEEMGSRAGRMARAILQGKKANSIPIEKATPHYVFNKEAMDKYGIAASSLPPQSKVIDFHAQTYQVEEKWFVALGLFVLALTAIGLAITFNNWRQKKLADEKNRAQIEQALCAAKKANAAKSEFLSNMSHEIRTPMNAILGYVNLALEDCQELNIRQYLNKINFAGNVLLGLISDILDMSRIDSKKVELQLEVVEIKKFFESLTALVTTQMEEKHITFIENYEGIVHPFVYLDKLRCQQIFMNLFSNATKFTHKNGRIEFHVKVDEIKDGIAYTTIEVKDNGVGMSTEFQKRVFEAFEQEHNSYIDNHTGTGLGMAITKNLVELMQGTISVNSTRNVGTTFTIKLPVKLAADDSKILEAKALTEDAILEGAQVLLVEDQMINIEIARKILQRAGCHVSVAMNGQEAVDKFKRSEENYYNLILMDIRMPIMNGLEATRLIRAMERKDSLKVPIIAFTANAFSGDVDEAKAAGIDAYLAKPIMPKTFIAVIKKELSEKAKGET